MACSKTYRQCIFSEEVVRLFGLDDPGFEGLWGEKGFIFFNGYQGSFPEVRQLIIEADHSTSSGAEVKKEWSYTSTPPYTSMVWTGKTLLSIIFFFLFLVLCYNLKSLL